MTYTIKMTRQTAIRYIAWEFGINRVQPMLAKLEMVSPGFFRLPIIDSLAKPTSARRLTKRNAEAAVCKIKAVNAFQAGRLGKPLNCGDVYAVAI